MGTFSDILISHDTYKLRSTTCRNKIVRIREIFNDLLNSDELIDVPVTISVAGGFGRLDAGTNSDLDFFLIANSKMKKEKDTLNPTVERIGHLLISNHPEFRGLYLNKNKNKRSKKPIVRFSFTVDDNGSLIANAHGQSIQGETYRLANGIVEKIAEARGRFKQELDIDYKDEDNKRLKTFVVQDLINATGTDYEDIQNHFTTRILFIIESRDVYNPEVWMKNLNKILEMYFRDQQGREDFVPAFLLNDLLRYWRTLWLNYEKDHTKPDKKWWEKSLKLSYSLKLSIFCHIFSTILLNVRTIESMKDLIIDPSTQEPRSPLERLAYALDNNKVDLNISASLLDSFKKCVDQYELFLQNKEKDLFKNKESKEWKEFRINSEIIRRFFRELYNAIPNDDPFVLGLKDLLIQ
ncbi:MAG: hypothetical protein ORN98_01890 [Alphaproteobacteria bacterium]|nr:hypothetical protein [Alphaproteobacteria bacterium]